MALEFSIHEEPGYLVIGVEGTFEIGDMKRMIQALMVEGKERGYDRAVVDISKVDGPIKQFDRFLIGQHAAENWRPGLRVAVVYRDEEINRFADECAPVDKVYWLPNALSEWRNKAKKGQTAHGSSTGKAARPKRVIAPGERDYDTEAKERYARVLAKLRPELDRQERERQATMP